MAPIERFVVRRRNESVYLHWNEDEPEDAWVSREPQFYDHEEIRQIQELMVEDDQMLDILGRSEGFGVYPVKIAISEHEV